MHLVELQPLATSGAMSDSEVILQAHDDALDNLDNSAIGAEEIENAISSAKQGKWESKNLATVQSSYKKNLEKLTKTFHDFARISDNTFECAIHKDLEVVNSAINKVNSVEQQLEMEEEDRQKVLANLKDAKEDLNNKLRTLAPSLSCVYFIGDLLLPAGPLKCLLSPAMDEKVKGCQTFDTVQVAYRKQMSRACMDHMRLREITAITEGNPETHNHDSNLVTLHSTGPQLHPGRASGSNQHSKKKSTYPSKAIQKAVRMCIQAIPNELPKDGPSTIMVSKHMCFCPSTTSDGTPIPPDESNCVVERGERYCKRVLQYLENPENRCKVCNGEEELGNHLYTDCPMWPIKKLTVDDATFSQYDNIPRPCCYLARKCLGWPDDLVCFWWSSLKSISANYGLLLLLKFFLDECQHPSIVEAKQENGPIYKQLTETPNIVREVKKHTAYLNHYVPPIDNDAEALQVVVGVQQVTTQINQGAQQEIASTCERQAAHLEAVQVNNRPSVVVDCPIDGHPKLGSHKPPTTAAIKWLLNELADPKHNLMDAMHEISQKIVISPRDVNIKYSSNNQQCTASMINMMQMVARLGGYASVKQANSWALLMAVAGPSNVHTRRFKEEVVPVLDILMYEQRNGEVEHVENGPPAIEPQVLQQLASFLSLSVQNKRDLIISMDEIVFIDEGTQLNPRLRTDTPTADQLAVIAAARGVLFPAITGFMLEKSDGVGFFISALDLFQSAWECCMRKGEVSQEVAQGELTDMLEHIQTKNGLQEVDVSTLKELVTKYIILLLPLEKDWEERQTGRKRAAGNAINQQRARKPNTRYM